MKVPPAEIFQFFIGGGIGVNHHQRRVRVGSPRETCRPLYTLRGRPFKLVAGIVSQIEGAPIMQNMLVPIGFLFSHINSSGSE